MRVRRAREEDWDEAITQRFGLKAELPSPFQARRPRGGPCFGRLQRACTVLFQILVGRNLREHGQLQRVDDMLRGRGAREDPGKKADEGDEHDRERCRRPGAQLIGGRELVKNGVYALLRVVERLGEDDISTTIGARKRRPPTIVVRTN